ncbi:TadE-like protein [Anaerobacterium chartisolvens]|uniref:TadE-like protein n=1 Tax=Anaerobacterium chartisolvens TaxID=1297424 RepID=A0A369AJL6_9FIRM|nr:TadE/TadG family type IV pilus assembly protein [Anaerobacterium chartisolvens]RCX09599.1 TadE-like protein [Anaerobacterium chartisolvens]
MLRIDRLKKGIKNNSRGSITVEACISFPVLLFFLLLFIFFIRIGYVSIALGHAVNETTKQLAASAYPIGMLNCLEDELFLDAAEGYTLPSFEDEISALKDKTLSDAGASLAASLLSGNAEDSTHDGMTEILEVFEAALKDYAVKRLGEGYYHTKHKLKNVVVIYFLNNFIDQKSVDPEKVRCSFIQIPQSNAERMLRLSNAEYLKACEQIGYTPEKDDVVISVEYAVNIPVPFFKRQVLLRYTSVERAWMNGRNGVYGGEADSSVEESYGSLKEDIVYITKTGSKYHKSDCPCLSSSKIPVYIKEALEKGYGRCGVCSNKGKWNFYK